MKNNILKFLLAACRFNYNAKLYALFYVLKFKNQHSKTHCFKVCISSKVMILTCKKLCRHHSLIILFCRQPGRLLTSLFTLYPF